MVKKHKEINYLSIFYLQIWFGYVDNVDITSQFINTKIHITKDFSRSVNVNET